MNLFDNENNEFLLCSSFEEEFPGDPKSDYLYKDAQVLKMRPTRQQAEQFYAYYVPAIGLQTGTLLSSKLEEIAFEGEIRLVNQGQVYEVNWGFS